MCPGHGGPGGPQWQVLRRLCRTSKQSFELCLQECCRKEDFCRGQFSNKPGWTQSHGLWKMFLTCLSICLPRLVKFSNVTYSV